MYRVVFPFADLEDNLHIYDEGDEYPRKGYKPSAERIKSLSTKANLMERPLIAKQKDKK